MHLFLEDGGFSVRGVALLVTIFPALLSIVLVLIGHRTGSRAATTAGMISMSLAVVGFLFPRMLNIMGNLRDSLIAAAIMAALAVILWLWPFLRGRG